MDTWRGFFFVWESLGVFEDLLISAMQSFESLNLLFRLGKVRKFFSKCYKFCKELQKETQALKYFPFSSWMIRHWCRSIMNNFINSYKIFSRPSLTPLLINSFIDSLKKHRKRQNLKEKNFCHKNGQKHFSHNKYHSISQSHPYTHAFDIIFTEINDIIDGERRR